MFMVAHVPHAPSQDEAKAARYAAVETAHCRGAMLAFSGVVTASAMFEKPFPYF